MRASRTCREWGPTDFFLSLPWQTEDEREIRDGSDAVLGEHFCRLLERLARAALPDLLETFIVAALGADEQSRRVGRDGRDESGMQQVSCPRVEQQPRLQPSILNHTSDFRRSCRVQRELVIDNVHAAGRRLVEMGERMLQARDDDVGLETAPRLAIRRAAERTVVRASA